ncbi:MAG TPA: TRAP transporter large permease subunit [Thermomicrobiales bacterium]|jgi:tripartite ATP-independent transporter DctM subunit|nr:TRAP transporter large permease subunit [Thermomicrobiales bacterium]
MIEGLIAFACVIALCFLGVRVGFASFLVGFIGFALLRDFHAASVMAGQEIVRNVMNYNLSVIPLFVLMGSFVYHSNISSELYDAMYALMGRARGALAQATVLTCAGFAAVCGSSLATAAIMTRVALPSMSRYKYNDALATGCVAAGGTLGILIPPSVPLIIYGIVAEQDIGRLFMAGILPGAMLVALFMAVIAIWLRFRPGAAPVRETREKVSYARSLKAIAPVAALFILVLGGIYLHVFTPTEAGGVGAVGAGLVALAAGRMRTLREWRTVLSDAALTSCSLFTVIVGALVFANYINTSGLAFGLVALVKALGLSPLELVIAIVLIALVMGMIFESIGILLLLVPAFLPALISQNVDLIWFGIIVVITVELGLITPPIGMNVFVVRNMAPDKSMASIFAGAIPFALAMLVALYVVIAVPGVATFLPDVMR